MKRPEQSLQQSIAPMVSISVPGRPVPWSRAGSNNGRRYTPKKQSAYMNAVATIAKVAMSRAAMQPLEGPVELGYRATYHWPKTWSDADREANGKWRVGRADVENLTKLVCDALSGITYIDDAQIVSLIAQKQYGLNEGIVVTVTSLNEQEASS